MAHQANFSRPVSRRKYFTSNSPGNKGVTSQSQDATLKLVEDNVPQEKQNSALTDSPEFGDDEEEENKSKYLLEEMYYSDARLGVCSVCHISVKETDSDPVDFGKALLCSNGHLLCHQCVEKFTIRSETKCVLCTTKESERSMFSESQSSVAKRTRSKKKSRTRIPRSHCKQQYVGEFYPSTNVVSCTNIASHYSIGTDDEKNLDSWNDSEHDNNGKVDNEFTQDYLRTARETKYRSYSNMSEEIKSVRKSKTQINSQMMSESSRRPIQCPLLNCAMNVAFSALTNHFIFDHPELPIINVDVGEKSTLVVNFDGLEYNFSHCLALLLVSGKLSGLAAKQFNGNHVPPQYRNRLPLPILAARLRCEASHDEIVLATGEGRNNRGDVIIAWVAGLDIGNSTTGALRCSIQAIDSIDSEAFRSLTYTGPINSLRAAQKPREVFLTGDCVILHDGFITSGCENLNVNVTIY